MTVFPAKEEAASNNFADLPKSYNQRDARRSDKVTGRRLILTVMATLSLMVAITPNAIAQPARLKDAIVGSWVLVSLRVTRPDGAVVTPYGPHPAGTMSFSQSGRFAIVLINPDIPKYASNDRSKPTPAEAMAIAVGSNALLGSYAVDGAARTITLHVEASSYPNEDGTDQVRVVKSIGDTEMVLAIPASPNGGAAAELVLKRAE
jgi:hypothetical protein